MYFSAENFPEVNPVAMSYKIRHNKNQPARYSLAWSNCFFCYYFWWQKNRKMWCGHVRLRARVAMEKGLLSV